MRISDWSSDVCSSDLDGQGYAVELPAQLRHRVGGLEDDTRVGGSLEEQPNRRRIDRPGGGQGQRSEGHDRLARELQRRAAGGEEGGHLARLQQQLDRLRGGDDHVLAVVEEHEDRPIARRVQERGARAVAELRGCRLVEAGARVAAGEVDVHDALAVVTGGGGGRGPGQGGLADPALSHYRDQARSEETTSELQSLIRISYALV